jgi:hypothetical protein
MRGMCAYTQPRCAVDLGLEPANMPLMIPRVAFICPLDEPQVKRHPHSGWNVVLSSGGKRRAASTVCVKDPPQRFQPVRVSWQGPRHQPDQLGLALVNYKHLRIPISRRRSRRRTEARAYPPLLPMPVHEGAEASRAS